MRSAPTFERARVAVGGSSAARIVEAHRVIQGERMKTLAALLIAASAVLAGCVAVPYDSGRPPPHAGYADRDRDRDGVPNRYDRDRDNDGVPNRYDSRPNNPNRY
jgi:hypothetical protein